MQLFKASRQWASRPDDERFWTLEEMHKACTAYRESAAEASVGLGSLKLVPQDGELLLEGRDRQARLSNWAFGQLARRVEAPADYLRTLSPRLAAENVNEGISRTIADRQHAEPNMNILFHSNGGLLARAITSDVYARIWNNEITERLIPLADQGWRVPPARPRYGTGQTRKATEADVAGAAPFGLGLKVGDDVGPAGLYASDHDMFAFMVDPDRVINDGTEGGLRRGFFIWNSEVGNGSWGIMTFLWRAICQNHIVYGAHNVNEIRIAHVGHADTKAWNCLTAEVRKYSESSASDEEATIEKARRFVLGQTKDETVQFVRKLTNVRKRDAVAAYEIAMAHAEEDGAPNTAWGMVNGLTRASQNTSFADERTDIDRAAGKLMQIEF